MQPCPEQLSLVHVIAAEVYHPATFMSVLRIPEELSPGPPTCPCLADANRSRNLANHIVLHRRQVAEMVDFKPDPRPVDGHFTFVTPDQALALSPCEFPGQSSLAK